MLFDAHVHIFPDKLKGKVLPKLSQIAKSEYYRDETLADALIANEKGGVTHCLVLHIATNPKQEKSVNDFAISVNSKNMISFGSVHPLSPDKISELHRLHENGIVGVKFHPDYQEFYSDDEIMDGVYETCEKLGLIVTFHTGQDPFSPIVIHNTPKRLANVAKKFPKLKIIAAHMGGMNMIDECLKELVGLENVYFDTAIASTFLSVEQFEELVKKHGVDKVLFATDSPWSTAKDEKEFIEKTNLTTEEKEKIYYKNAAKLFSISL